MRCVEGCPQTTTNHRLHTCTLDATARRIPCALNHNLNSPVRFCLTFRLTTIQISEGMGWADIEERNPPTAYAAIKKN